MRKGTKLKIKVINTLSKDANILDQFKSRK
jgi:hypothetical protein